MTLLELCQLIENSYVGTSIRESNYYWMLNGTHVLGIGISVGAIFWFDLRAMGLNMRHMRVSEVYRQINAWMLGGFAAMVVTGVLLFWARAASSYANPYFLIKLAAMGLAGINAMYFNARTKRGIAGWDTVAVPPLSVRLAGLASIILWFAVIAAGRMMAYTF
jgi:uncharacterized protein DUF6644